MSTADGRPKVDPTFEFRSTRLSAAAGAFAACIVGAFFAGALFTGTARGVPGVELASPDGAYPAWLDPAVSPRRDFYRFANGGWIKSHPIPADRSSWGVDTILERETQTQIRQLVETSPAGPVADFYASGMDQAAVDAAGARPLQPEFERLDAIASTGDLLLELAHLQMIGVAAPWQIGQMQDFKDSTRVIAVAMQGGLGLPNRDYYLRPEASFVAARTAYVSHVTRMFALLGDSPAAAAREAKVVMAFESRLAASSMSDVEQRSPQAIYHPMTVQAADALTRHLRWSATLAALGHAEIGSLNLGMPQFFAAVDRELADTSIADWKTYLRWQLVDSCAPYLSTPFVDEEFRMTRVLTGALQLQPRWLRVLRAEDEALGFAIGRQYVERAFPAASKAAATAVVAGIREALRADLATLSWMTPETRAAAIAKLDLMELRVGYPDQWRDYSGLDIDRGSYVLNVLRARGFDERRQLAKIGKPVDRSEWAMTPQTVNAYYDPSMNSLNIPAGILQPPYFSADWPDAVNYGATGAAVGHEMTHGFDDEGAQFDGHGNLRDWWAAADLAKFREATRCIADQYSRLTVDGGLHVQGELVTGEAVADLGGLVLAWRAFHARPSALAGTSGSLTPEQQFFIAFAHSWADVVRPEQARESVTTDPHPPAEYRTNATLANSPSPMVKVPRCVIW